jgi:uncharacterized Ntn-hydrolase superfamily protein
MTYSIVARDEETGQLGVAVQTAWFAVGRAVPWAEAGVGAVAIQSFAERAHGPLALDALRSGRSPKDVLRIVLEDDAEAGYRQIGIVAADGRADGHTGNDCVPDAGHVIGDGYAAQANMMSGPGVWEAIADAYENSGAPFALRLLDALNAGERAGGDFRGRQSAALLVVPGDASSRPWDRLVELRVDDHPEPLTELRRLLALHEAYEALSAGRPAPAEAPLRQTARVWASALAAANVDDLVGAKAALQPLLEADPRWREVVRAYGQRGRFPGWEQIIDGLIASHSDLARDTRGC